LHFAHKKAVPANGTALYIASENLIFALIDGGDESYRTILTEQQLTPHHL